MNPINELLQFVERQNYPYTKYTTLNRIKLDWIEELKIEYGQTQDSKLEDKAKAIYGMMYEDMLEELSKEYVVVGCRCSILYMWIVGRKDTLC